jgi:hypothetical protein
VTAWTPERERRAIVEHGARCRFCRALLAHSRHRADRQLLDAAEQLAEEHTENEAQYAALAGSSFRSAATQQPRRSSLRIVIPGGDHDA